MSIRLRSVGWIAASLLVFALVTCLVVSAFAASSPREEYQEQATQLCGRCVSHLLPVAAPVQGRVPELVSYVEDTTGDEFLADTRRGIVGFWSAAAIERLAEQRSTDRLLPETSLDAIAEAEARRILGNAASENLRPEGSMNAVGFNEDGTCSTFEYCVQLVQYLDGLPTSNRLLMTLNPSSGEVTSIVKDIGDIQVDIEPALTAEQAVTVLQEEFSMPVVTSKTSELNVWRDPVDLQPHLAWIVEIRTGSSSGFGCSAAGVVDAQTGDLLQGMVSD